MRVNKNRFVDKIDAGAKTRQDKLRIGEVRELYGPYMFDAQGHVPANSCLPTCQPANLPTRAHDMAHDGDASDSTSPPRARFIEHEIRVVCVAWTNSLDLSRFMRILRVESVDEMRSVLDECGRFPWIVQHWISLPFDEIHETFANAMRIEDFLNFILLLGIDDDRKWRRMNAAQDDQLEIRFEEGYVEDILNLHRRREAKLIILKANLFDNTERTELFPTEFLGGPLGLDVLGQKSDFVINGELNTFMLWIVILSLLILSVLEDFEEVIVEFSKWLDEWLGCSDDKRGLVQVNRESGMIIMIGKKWRTLKRGLIEVVDGEFGDRQEVKPVILLIVATYAKILFEDLIHALDLTIDLWMKCGGKTTIDIKDIRERGPKMRGKNRSTIRDDRVRNAMQSDDMIQKHSSEIRCIGSFVTRYKMDHFRETVDKNENSIKSMRLREIDDVIRRNRFPETRWDGKRHKFAVRDLTRWFAARTQIAGRYVWLNVAAHTRKPVIPRQEFEGLGYSELTDEWIVVMHSKYFETELIIFWEIDEIITKQESILAPRPKKLKILTLSFSERIMRQGFDNLLAKRNRIEGRDKRRDEIQMLG
jgi:hypothetical protein